MINIRFRLVSILRDLADHIELKFAPYVRDPAHVRQDIRRIMVDWPGKPFTFTEIYCRSSMGMDLEIGLHEMVELGFVKEVGSHPREGKIYVWNEDV